MRQMLSNEQIPQEIQKEKNSQSQIFIYITEIIIILWIGIATLSTMTSYSREGKLYDVCSE